MEDTETGHLRESFVNKYCASIDECERQRFLKRPSVMLKVDLKRDGNMWSALYGSNIVEGVCGFGETPDEAYADFDKAWYGKDK